MNEELVSTVKTVSQFGFPLNCKSYLMVLSLLKPNAGDVRFYFSQYNTFNGKKIKSIVYEPGLTPFSPPYNLGFPKAYNFTKQLDVLTPAQSRTMVISLVDTNNRMFVRDMPLMELAITNQTGQYTPVTPEPNKNFLPKLFDSQITFDKSFVRFVDPSFTVTPARAVAFTIYYQD